MEKTLELEVPLLLPGIEDGRERCIERLEGALVGRRGIGRAHVERDQAPPRLCLHESEVGMVSLPVCVNINVGGGRTL